jgi:chorismate mutase/prephenate dehydratase
VIALTLDMFLSSDLKICSEIYVPIQHNLLSKAKSLSDVKRIYTMFQATGQCREWLARHAAKVQLVEAGNTARGAGMAAEDPESAAIANPTAAEEYGLGVLAEHIEDNPRNRTRFWVVGRMQPGPSGRDKTSLLFSVAHRPGALNQALQSFSDHGISLTFIQSRPTKQTPWEYDFFVDVVGHVGEGPDAPLNRALEQLRSHAQVVRVLGSYPEAEDA